MNTPTHCSDCGNIWPLAAMTHDAEGHFHCPKCESERLSAARFAIDRLRSADFASVFKPKDGE